MSEKQKNLPFVSVIMPVQNEKNFIKRSLGAVLEQDYPKHLFEVIVADGNSTDGTDSIIGLMQKESIVSIKIVKNPKAIAPSGLNAAIKQSVGDVIIRVDGHTIIEPDYISECVAALENSDADNVGGRMNAVATNLTGEAIAVATSSPFGIGNAAFHYSEKEQYVDTVYLGAWRREVFDRIGLFDEELVRNQDDEFNYRLRASGGRILLSPQIESRYYNRSSWKKLWTQYFQYGYWKVRVLQKHPKQMQPRQFIPLAFVAAIIFLAFLSLFSDFGLYLLLIILGLYSVANLLAALSALGVKRLFLFPLVSLSFAILHFSYGTGFLCGLWAFRNKWRECFQTQPAKSNS